MDDARILQSTILQQSLEEIQAQDAEAEPCVICLEPISEGATTQPCQHHNFDYLCLLSWLEQQSSCPLCKALVEKIEYVDPAGRTRSYNVPERKVSSANPVPASGGGGQRWARGQRPRLHRPMGRSNTPANAVLMRRRDVYLRQLYSLHVGNNRISTYQDLTPTRIANTPALLSRARGWIRRELEVFTFLSGVAAGASSSAEPANSAEHAADPPSLRNISNAFFLLEYVVAILKTVDIKDSSGQAQNMLAEFLGRANARLFLHELGSFLRSPYETVEAWDRHVQYPKGSEGSANEANNSAMRKRPVQQQRTESGTIRGGQYDPDHHNSQRKRRMVDKYVPD